MDRVISLLAALVGLIALCGALLVHNNATASMQRQAAEIAALREALTSGRPVAAVTAPAPREKPEVDNPASSETIASLESRVASLESNLNAQAVQLAAARAALDARASLVPSAEPVTEVAALAPAEQPPSGTQPAAYNANGPTDDCIPLGTRFMAQSGDSFPICKTNIVVDVTGVSDGAAIVEDAGVVAAGALANLSTQGCTIMVFTADITGFAEMRVSCT